VSLHRRPARRLIAIGSLLAAAVSVPLAGAPAHASTASGTIQQPRPIGNGATDVNFNITCPAMPQSQGVDGYVFEIPAGTPVGTLVSVTQSGDQTGLADVEAYVYKGCNYDRVENSATQDLYVTTTAGDQYLSVFVTNGANVGVTFTSPATPPATGFPNDPLYNQNGAGDLLLDGQWNMRTVHAVDAWNVATGSGITVADLDTGLDLGHPDFSCAGKVTLVPGADVVHNDGTPEDDNGHGTHTAGIIGACTNNGVGVVGVAPDSTIMPIQVLDEAGSGNAATLATAIHKATDNGAHVINMSIGFSASGAPYSGSALGFVGLLPEIDEAVSYAVAHGVVVVASAGNESAGLCSYPALAYNVVCVGSSDPHDLNSWYGNFPVKDDDEDLVGPGVLAPGGTGGLFCDASSFEIISTYDRSADAAEGDCDTLPGYAAIEGTSMAAPMVSGIAALVYEKLGGTRSTANAQKVVQAITGGAKDLYTPGYDPMSGYGRVDALGAVNYWP
jgi:subtilisin family serine protease